MRLFLYQLLNNKTELRNFISDMLFCPLRMRTKNHRHKPYEKTHGLLWKIQGTYFKICALYFKIYALYFSPFQTPETQQLTKAPKSASKTPPQRGKFRRFATHFIRISGHYACHYFRNLRRDSALPSFSTPHTDIAKEIISYLCTNILQA